MRPYAGADYNPTLPHSQLRSPALHPSYKKMGGVGEGRYHLLVGHICLSANFHKMFFYVNRKRENSKKGQGKGER